MLNIRLIALSFIGLALCDPAVTNIYIDAIEPCSIYFTFNATSGQSLMTNCTYQLPGANVTYLDWATCYGSCCPGLVAPANSTLNDIQTCVTTYSSTPFLVTLTGILLGIFICMIFVVIPCCCSKDGAYYQLKKAITEKLADDENEQSAVESRPIKEGSKPKEEQMKIIFTHNPASQYVLHQPPHRLAINDDAIDDFPSEERKCSICKQGKSNLRLKCSHRFHNHCLNGKAKELRRCQDCSSEEIYPVAAYCSICERRYSQLQAVSLESTYICRVCEER